MNTQVSLKGGFFGQAVPTPVRCSQRLPARRAATANAQENEVQTRRALLGMVAGGAALLSGASPSLAGPNANVFGKATNTSGYIPYSGEGWSLQLPSKWNPSKEREYKGIELRYEDNGDAVNNVVVISRKTDKRSIKDFGSPEDFLSANAYLFGEQIFKGETASEGGFKKNKTSAASILDVQTGQDKKGKDFYKYEVLVRSADDNEGGRHNLITATVGSGNLYILKVQIGDKRWFKGAKAVGVGLQNSFTVA